MSRDNMMPPQDVIEAFAKECQCCSCCQNPPCDGVMAGGLCDRQECSRDGDELDVDDDSHDDCDCYGHGYSDG